MFERLEKMRERFNLLGEMIVKPEVMARREEWQKLVKEHAALEPVIAEYEKYLGLDKEMRECQDMMEMGEADIKELAEAEYYRLKEEKEKQIVRKKSLN